MITGGGVDSPPLQFDPAILRKRQRLVGEAARIEAALRECQRLLRGGEHAFAQCIGFAARSPWILVLTLPLAITLRYGVVAREEAYLERRFGDAYRDYKARVRRWL